MRSIGKPTRLVVTLLLISALAVVANSQDLVFGGQDDGELVSSADLLQATPVFSYSSAVPGRTYPAALVLDIKDGWHINTATPYQDWLIPALLEPETTGVLTPGPIQYPAGEDAQLVDETITVWGAQVIIHFDVTIAPSAAPGEYELPMQFTYQPCDDQICVAPETIDLTLGVTVGDDGAPINPEFFDGESESGATHSDGQASQDGTGDIQELIDKYGIWGYFLALGLAFVTGLALSFSPCTYPMIPITVSIFAGQDRSVGRGFIMSLFYVGSMAMVYGLMGLVVASVGGVFGAWLASPAVVISIAVIFVVFALSMFGLFEVQVPMFIRQKLGTTKGGGGIGGAIVLGIVAAMVVSPCVGPFVAGILLYIATSGSPLIGFLTLFVFALGLGTLFMIIGTFSNTINKLPRAGEWMEQVKKFFGFILILMAIYFLRTIIDPTLVAVLTGLLLLSYAVMGGGLDTLRPDSGGFARLKKLLGVLAMIIGIYLLLGTILVTGLVLPPISQWLPASTVGHATQSQHMPWVNDLEAGLQQARRSGKPVVIDTWATWCANCRVLEKKTFGNADVIAAAKRFVPIRVQLEKAGTPETQDFMTRFGLRHYSLPTTLLIDSKGEVQRVLQGVVGPEEMIDFMNKVH